MSRYASTRLVSVTPYRGATIKYGFKTNVEERIGREAGHTPVNADITGLVIGANAPKPAQGTKKDVRGSVIQTYSTFVDAGRLRSLPANWSVGKPKVRRGRATPKTVIAYVTINGIKYAWNLPKTTQSKIGATVLTQLGIKIATSADKDLVFGSSFPKPPRVGSTKIGGGGGIDDISTYCDPSVMDNLPAGFAPIKDSGDEF